MKDLKEKAIRGGAAKLCNVGISFAIRLSTTAVLARILDPKDFGLVAMVTVVTGVYGLFTTAGLSSATVQRASVTDDQVSTLFWINMLVGLILSLLCLATAPVLANFYHEPRLFWVTVALAVGFLINAAGVQHSALVQRQMRFVALTVIDVISSVFSNAVGIAMAVGGAGYWALVGMAISYPIASTVCLWTTAAWVPGKPRRGAGIRSMIRFGGTITLNSLVMYIAYNLEKVLLGRFWGADVLGLYGRAYSLINIPTENLNIIVGSIAFSAIARVQNEPDRLKNYFLKGYSLVMSMTLPITIFSALFADDLILILLGPKWKEAAVIFRLMTPTILVFGMLNPFGWLLQSIGMQERSLKIALVLAPLVIASYVIGLPYGPRGVAFAYSMVMILVLVPLIAWSIHGTIFSSMDILQTISRPLLSCIVAAAFAFGIRYYCDQWLAPLPRLLLGFSVMFCIYLMMLLFVMGQREFYLNLLKGVKKSPSPEIQEPKVGVVET